MYHLPHALTPLTMYGVSIQKSGPLTFLDLERISFEEIIGRGKFVVLKARMTGKVMAVKRMDCDKMKIPEEVKIHNALPPHPHIIRLLGVAHSNDGFSINICMELADKSLYHYLHKEKKEPPVEKGTKWAKQIAMGMDHLHQNGLAHLDLKSLNVLLFEKEDILKLCDFGEARVLEGTVTTTGLTGTCRWMAPEFNDKKRRINQRCDVFSYGMILFEIFAHQIPFSNIKDAPNVLPLIKKGDRPSIAPQVPTHIKDLTEFCWKHNPHDRPTSGKILQVG